MGEAILGGGPSSEIRCREALDRLRADPATTAIPVMALTAQAMAGNERRLLAAGFDGYLTKPNSVREFPEQVRRFVAREVS